MNEPMGIGGLNKGSFVSEGRKRKKVGGKGSRRKEGRKEGQKGKGKEVLKGHLSVGPNLGKVRESMS